MQLLQCDMLFAYDYELDGVDVGVILVVHLFFVETKEMSHAK
jgi:hypothetical protein